MTSMWSPTGDALDRLDRQGYGRGPANREELERAADAQIQQATKDKGKEQD